MLSDVDSGGGYAYAHLGEEGKWEFSVPSSQSHCIKSLKFFH